MLNSAIELASNAHFFQRRKKSGLPYIVHPLDVMNILIQYGVTDEFVLSLAVLHDVYEDCDKMYRDVIQVDYGWWDMDKALEAISKKAGQTLQEYTNQVISGGTLVALVKLADIKSNTREKLSDNYLEAKLDQVVKLAPFISQEYAELLKDTIGQIFGHMKNKS